MTSKYIQDIRRIAKTDELLKRIPNNTPDVDKASIGMRRGIGYPAEPYNPCKVLYKDTDGSYTFAGLVAGTEGAKTTDGTYNQCALVNTITGMRESGDAPQARMLLNPDGVFKKAGQKFYFSGWVFTYCSYVNEYTTQPFFSDDYWFYPTKETALIADVAAFEAYTLVTGGDVVTGVAGDLELMTITQDYLDTLTDFPNTTLTTSSVFYKSLVEYSGDASGEYYASILEVVNNYEYFANPDETIARILIPSLDPIDGDFTGAYNDGGMSTFYPQFELAIDVVGKTNLWKPNPAENTAPLKYKNGVSIIALKFGSGYTRTGMVRPGKDGGFVLFETSGETPTGDAYVYRRDRTLTIVVPASQVQPYLA